jgi:membrane protease YdiL (CAAX protease family)
MAKNRSSLVQYPWLFLLVFLLSTVILNILATVLLVVIFKLPRDAPTTGLLAAIFSYGLMAFVIVPFGMRFHDRSQLYSTYLSEIRLTHVQPLLKLILLGISCFLILALCMAAGTLIYRLSQGQVIDLAFFRSAFPITSEFPPNSWGFLGTFPSIFEELAFRGVVLALFLRFYNRPKAILFSALGFGVIHAFSLLAGHAPIWAAGMVVWATLLGLFYGYITLKTDSLLPAMLVHYLGNLFLYPLTAYLQNNAPITVQVSYGIILTMGIIPVLLMSLWSYLIGKRLLPEG